MISFILALVFAIPTYGISILIWIVWLFVKGFVKGYLTAKTRIASADQRQFVRNVMIQPLLGGYSELEFFNALDIPLTTFDISEEDKEMCIHHILNFISNNKEIAGVFIQGAKRFLYPDKSEGDAFLAASAEKENGDLGFVHYAVYVAILSLCSNNHLPCFNEIDLVSVATRVKLIGNKYS